MCLLLIFRGPAELERFERGGLVLPVISSIRKLTPGRHRQGSLMLRADESEVPHTPRKHQFVSRGTDLRQRTEP